MLYFVTIDGEERSVDVERRPNGEYSVRIVRDGREVEVASEVAEGDALWVRLDGKVFDMAVGGSVPELDVTASGRRALVQVESERSRATGALDSKGGGGGAGTIKSPMPGKVVKLLVAEGDTVEVGAPVVVVEAMKMENELCAESAGSVKKVFVAPGDAVEGGAKLVTIA